MIEIIQLTVLGVIALAIIFLMLKLGRQKRNIDDVLTYIELSKEKQEKDVLFFSTEFAKLNSLRERDKNELVNSLAKQTFDIKEVVFEVFKLNSEESAKNRKELSETLEQFSTRLNREFDTLRKKQDALLQSTDKKLDNMREIVDEKLHKTLENRLGQSFKLVSERLEAVQKGLGEMKSLANGVGDLKKVLTNVKTRGVLGEIQLENILEQIMTPEQYDKNVKTKKGSNHFVEFAVKLPGNDKNENIYLPIDAKFPQEDYIRLQDAYDLSDVLEIEKSKKALVNAITLAAKDIFNKYIDPPNTTNFAILFLPFEGLFAEITRHPGLLEKLQRDYKIVVTGPTTLSAMLNSLQMGFKTLTIQKRSSEVWDVLAAVKKEFHTFGGVLEKAQKKISDASSDIDKLVGTRTRMMLSKLNKIEENDDERSLDF